MERGPRWTLRMAALLLGSAPFLHMFNSGRAIVRGPFEDLRVLGDIFERAQAAWFFCWLLPLVASFPSFRAYWATVGFSFVAYIALLFSLSMSWSPGVLVWFMGLGGLFLLALLLRRVEAEVVSAWARVLIAATLVAACGLEYRKTSTWAVGSVFVLAGATLAAVGEVVALRSEEPSPENSEMDSD